MVAIPTHLCEGSGKRFVHQLHLAHVVLQPKPSCLSCVESNVQNDGAKSSRARSIVRTGQPAAQPPHRHTRGLITDELHAALQVRDRPKGDSTTADVEQPRGVSVVAHCRLSCSPPRVLQHACPHPSMQLPRQAIARRVYDRAVHRAAARGGPIGAHGCNDGC